MQDSEIIKDPKKILPGSGLSWHKFKKPDYRILQTFKNPGMFPGQAKITFKTNEMTALCPLTGFPDQYTVELDYLPKNLCIESKSAKFYFGSYRDFGGFIEQVAERIFKDWIQACDPVRCHLVITMNPRGGVGITVEKHYQAKDKQ